MKKELQSYGFYLFPLLTFGAVLYLFFTIDLIQVEKINSLRTDLAGVSEKLSGLRNKNLLLSSLNKDELDKNYREVSKILPDLKDAPTIVQTLDLAASASGLKITKLDFTPGKIASGDPEREISVKVSGLAEVSQIASFTGTLLTCGRVMSLDNLDIRVDEEATADAIMADFSLRAYYLTPETKKIAPDGPLAELDFKDKEVLERVMKTKFVPVEITASASAKPDLFK